ncbi:MAG: AAA family ATPase [Eggerthellaceae bacterium]|nr:AAA family ATPase [Eggerthellaceae bacterium]
MGIYLNPGNGMFQKSLDSEIYVDKSGMIARTNHVLNTLDRYLCVSRPRRFGKTMALDMLAAYYGRGCDSRGQFAGLAIADDPGFGEHLNRYDVIRIVMNDFLARSGNDVEALISSLERRVRREVMAAYPDVCAYDDDILADTLAQAYLATGIPFVILVDEWDCVMRVMQGDERSQRRYLDWLRNLLKDREYVALAYATGILPVKKYGEHSALNMFTEVSILNAAPFSEFTGFTDGEVSGLCGRYGTDIEEMRRWYDGYDVDGIATYNPRSVVQALVRGVLDSYWTQTETYDALRRYIVLDMDGLRGKVVRLIGGEAVPVDVGTAQNDMTTFNNADDVLTLLVHLGYLTYDRSTRTVRVPNSEVAAEFVASIKDDPGWAAVAGAIASSDALMAATLSGHADAVAAGIERAHQENASVLRYNDENSLACAVALAYYAARRTHAIEREAPAGKGFADLLFRPRPGVDAPAFVVELKAGGTPDEALAQIRARGYAEALSAYREVFLVGIAYDPDSSAEEYKTHLCAIERL